MTAQKYRVFISYSHEDAELVSQLEGVLKSLDLTILRDITLEAGKGFTEQIKTYISYAHVFLPILTPTSNARLWVHQEIGFAVALNIPLIPISIGLPPGKQQNQKVQYPEGMIDKYQAKLLAYDLSDAKEKLTRRVFENRIKAKTNTLPPYYCAMRPEQRARILAESAAEVESIHGLDFVRQKGGLTTFGIPNRHINHPDWDLRYPNRPKSDHQKEELLAERQALGKHAVEMGCRLIVNPHLDYDVEWGPGATCARLSVLLSFLESMPDERLGIALLEKHPPHNVTLIGDWFVAESLAGSMRRGVEQTLLTKHAPSVRERMEKFDQEFFELLEQNGVKEEKDSRQYAIDRLRKLIRDRGC